MCTKAAQAGAPRGLAGTCPVREKKARGMEGAKSPAVIYQPLNQ
jgi:hypothetical protein